MAMMIYKILTARDWQACADQGYFDGSAVDLADGYIHFSTAKQLAETLARHYAGAPNLVLLAVNPDRLDAAHLRWEEARGGQLFPHLYDRLELAAVENTMPLSLDAKGRHILPADLENGNPKP
jgi:uncharacterized protein (DUF952 family)